MLKVKFDPAPPSPEGLVMPLVTLLLLIAPLAYWQGYALSVLWGWFVVPLGVEGVSPLHALGLAVLARVLISTHNGNPDSLLGWDGTGRFLLHGLFAPCMFLAVGWLIHAAM